MFFTLLLYNGVRDTSRDWSHSPKKWW